MTAAATLRRAFVCFLGFAGDLASDTALDPPPPPPLEPPPLPPPLLLPPELDPPPELLGGGCGWCGLAARTQEEGDVSAQKLGSSLPVATNTATTAQQYCHHTSIKLWTHSVFGWSSPRPAPRLLLPSRDKAPTSSSRRFSWSCATLIQQSVQRVHNNAP